MMLTGLQLRIAGWLAIAIAGGAIGGTGAWLWRAGEVARAQHATDVVQQQVDAYKLQATGQAATAADMARLAERNAWQELFKSISTQLAALASGMKRAETAQKETAHVIETQLAAPEWACLHRPLPAAVTGSLLDTANGAPAEAGSR